MLRVKLKLLGSDGLESAKAFSGISRATSWLCLGDWGLTPPLEK